MTTRNLVEFVGKAAAAVPDELKPLFAAEIEHVTRAILPKDDCPLAITVPDCFTSFTIALDRRAVFGVEVRTGKRYQTHIIKLGLKKDVEKDAKNWQAGTVKGVASRIFTPVIPVALRDSKRFAVVYQDGYTLCGPNRDEDQPESLEAVTQKAVNKFEPSVPSVERAIAHVYADLGRWFFPMAKVNRAAATGFYRGHLKCDTPKSQSTSRKTQEPVLDLWMKNPTRCNLRRDVVWVINGRDKPDLDPAAIRYLDPVEYIGWVLAKQDGSRLPESLVGNSHGDLHARNIILGVRRGEAEYPVVFDYGEMGTQNVLAWDFAKLECELVRRLLPPLLADDATRDSLAQASNLRPKVNPEISTLGPREQEEVRYRRKCADRIRAALEFHELLHQLTIQIDSRSTAEKIGQPVTSTKLPEVDRLLAVLLRVRAEAAFWLGFERSRKSEWQNELYFAIAVHGLINVRWDYDVPDVEIALVGSGVAIARMQSSAGILKAAAAKGPTAKGPFPSYWVPLAITHGLWSARDHQAADSFIKREVAADSANAVSFAVRPAYQHAIPLLAEALLIQFEVGNPGVVEEPLDKQIRPLAKEFGDFETLARIGRMFKDSGDKKWEESKEPFDKFMGTTGWQMYKKAFAVYSEAYDATDDYYVGINAATLAYLTHDMTSAKRIAEKVAKACSNIIPDSAKVDRYWLFATEGEAALIIGRAKDALRFYSDAIAELNNGQGGLANSAYKQLCRLAKAIGEEDEKVAPLLDLFENSQFSNFLVPGRFRRKSPPVKSVRK